jgi:N-sulfoglucosamine sulfohydrolase
MDHVASGGLYPSRAVRTARFKYIENEQSELDYSSEPMAGRAWHEMVRVAASDPRVAERVAKLVRRPARELYDVESDPYELRNLAGFPAHEATRRALAERLRAWRRSIEDPRLDAASTNGARPSS